MKDEIELILTKIQQIFPDMDTHALLDRFGRLEIPEKYRVALAILKLCQEDGKEHLDYYFETAERDYRDVLMWAEFPNQMKLHSTWTEPTKRVKEASKADRKQYLDWLNDNEP